MTTIEAWLVGGPNDGDTLVVDLDAQTLTVDGHLYVRGTDLYVPAWANHAGYTHAAWFDHEARP